MPEVPAHDRAAQLAQLRVWVDGILIPSYTPPEGTLRPCWTRHMSAVWELSTLAAEWKRVYQARSRDLQGALDFHDRWLPPFAASARRSGPARTNSVPGTSSDRPGQLEHHAPSPSPRGIGWAWF